MSSSPLISMARVLAFVGVLAAFGNANADAAAEMGVETGVMTFKERCLHLSVSTNVPSLDVVVDVRGETKEAVPPSEQSATVAKCSPGQREATLEVNAGVGINLLLVKILAVMEGRVTVASDNAPALKPMVKAMMTSVADDVLQRDNVGGNDEFAAAVKAQKDLLTKTLKEMGLKTWSEGVQPMSVALEVGRVAVAVEFSKFLQQLGGALFCWDGGSDCIEQDVLTGRAVDTGVLAKLAKSVLGKGWRKLAVGQPAEVAEGAISTARHAIKMILHKVTELVVLRFFGVPASKHPNGFSDFTCDQALITHELSVDDLVEFMQPEMAELFKKQSWYKPGKLQKIKMPGRLLCALIESYPYGKFTEGDTPVEDDSDRSRKIVVPLTVPPSPATAAHECASMDYLAALAKDGENSPFCAVGSLTLDGTATPDPKCSVHTPKAVANLFPRFYEAAYMAYEAIDIRTSKLACNEPTRRNRASLMGLDLLKDLIRTHLDPIDARAVSPTLTKGSPKKPVVNKVDWTFREFAGLAPPQYVKESYSGTAPKDLPSGSGGLTAGQNQAANVFQAGSKGLSVGKKLKGAALKATQKCMAYVPKAAADYADPTPAAAAPALTCPSNFDKVPPPGQHLPALIFKGGQSCGWIFGMASLDDFENAMWTRLTRAKQARASGATFDMEYTFSFGLKFRMDLVTRNAKGPSNFCAADDFSTLQAESRVAWTKALSVTRGVISARQPAERAWSFRLLGNPIPVSLPGFLNLRVDFEYVHTKEPQIIVGMLLPLFDFVDKGGNDLSTATGAYSQAGGAAATTNLPGASKVFAGKENMLPAVMHHADMVIGEIVGAVTDKLAAAFAKGAAADPNVDQLKKDAADATANPPDAKVVAGVSGGAKAQDKAKFKLKAPAETEISSTEAAVEAEGAKKGAMKQKEGGKSKDFKAGASAAAKKVAEFVAGHARDLAIDSVKSEIKGLAERFLPAKVDLGHMVSTARIQWAFKKTGGKWGWDSENTMAELALLTSQSIEINLGAAAIALYGNDGYLYQLSKLNEIRKKTLTGATNSATPLVSQTQGNPKLKGSG